MRKGYVALTLVLLLSGCDKASQAISAVTPSVGVSSGVSTLYSYWQAINKPEPGRYADEMISGKVYFTCKAEGKYAASMGELQLKTTFDMFALKSPKPFTVYVGGIEYPENGKAWSAADTTGGVGILSRLMLNGCEIPTDVLAAANARAATVQAAEKAREAEDERKATQDRAAEAVVAAPVVTPVAAVVPTEPPSRAAPAGQDSVKVANAISAPPLREREPMPPPIPSPQRETMPPPVTSAELAQQSSTEPSREPRTWTASYDCNVKLSGQESLICGSPVLSALDVRLAAVYREALERVSDREGLKATQRAWRRKERDGCSDATCIALAYTNRLKELAAAR